MNLRNSKFFLIPLLLLALSIPFALGHTNVVAQRPMQYTPGITATDLSVSESTPAAISPALMISGSIVPSVSPGSSLTIQFTAVYLTGARSGVANETVALFPQTTSFGFSTPGSNSYFKTLTDQYLTATSKPGTYTYSFQVTPDFPTGTVTMWILAGSLHDANQNWGPPADTSSDLSRLEIGAPESWLAKYGVPLAISALLILALILFLTRRRKKKK